MQKIIKPFGNNILIAPHEKKQVLVAERKSNCEYGTVLSIGDDVQHITVGDVIGFTVFGVNSLDIEDARYYFIPETAEFILGTIHE